MLLKEASPAHAAVRGSHNTPTFTTALQALIMVLFMASLQELVTAHPGDPLQESFLGAFLLPCAGLFMGPLTYRGALTGPPSAALLAASPAPLVALVVMGLVGAADHSSAAWPSSQQQLCRAVTT